MSELTVSDKHTNQIQDREQFYITKEQIELLRKTYAKDATEDEFKMFLMLAQKYQLDPFKREIFFIKYKRRNANGKYEEVGQTFAGRDGFLSIAHRTRLPNGTPAFDGMESGVEKVNEPLYVMQNGKRIKVRDWQYKGWCKVYRKDMSHPFYVEVWEEEYTTNRNLWLTKPRTMIQKVAESQALRRAFNISGLYAPEEILDKHVDNEKVVEPEVVVETPTKSNVVTTNTKKLDNNNNNNNNNGTHYVSQQQLKYIHVLLKKKGEILGLTVDDLKAGIKEEFKVEHLSFLTKEQASRLITDLKKEITILEEKLVKNETDFTPDPEEQIKILEEDFV